MIVKAEITLTLLMNTESVLDADVTLTKADLNYIVSEMDDGEWLGSYVVTRISEVHKWDVGTECLALGGDIDFFDEEV